MTNSWEPLGKGVVALRPFMVAMLLLESSDSLTQRLLGGNHTATALMWMIIVLSTVAVVTWFFGQILRQPLSTYRVMPEVCYVLGGLMGIMSALAASKLEQSAALPVIYFVDSFFLFWAGAITSKERATRGRRGLRDA